MDQRIIDAIAAGNNLINKQDADKQERIRKLRDHYSALVPKLITEAVSKNEAFIGISFQYPSTVALDKTYSSAALKEEIHTAMAQEFPDLKTDGIMQSYNDFGSVANWFYFSWK